MKWPASKTVTTPEARIQYYEFGSATGTPVFLLHGFPDAPIGWQGVLEHLDLSHLRVMVPYLRGYGESAAGSLDLVGGQEAALGSDVLALADALGIERIHLVGHDWGARASYAAAILAPERVKTLLTLATPYIMYGGKTQPPAQVRAHWYQWAFQLELGREVFTADPKAFCHQLWTSWSPDWTFSESDFNEAAKAWTGEQFIATVLQYYRMRWGGTLSLRAYAERQAKLNAKPKAKNLRTVSLYTGRGRRM